MNRSLSLLSLSALLGLLALSAPVRAQKPPTPAPQPPANPVAPASPVSPVAPVPPVSPVDPVAPARAAQPPRGKVNTLVIMGDYFSGMLSESLQKKVEFEAREMPALDAIKAILDQIKLPYDISPEATTDAKITMTLKGVPAVYALMLITREAKLGFAFESKDGKEIVHIIKIPKPTANRITARIPSGNTNFNTTSNVRVRPEVYASIANEYTSNLTISGGRYRTESALAPRVYGQAVSVAGIPFPMPDVRVKLDARNIEIRDALKKVLDQAKLPYVMDDDVPEKLKRSFTFENVPIGTALDVICRSADLGWIPETQPGSATVIHIGKKLNRQFRIYGPGASTGTFPFDSPEAAALPPVAIAVPAMERRATFTCPYCKAKQTIVLKDEGGAKNKAKGQSQSQEKAAEESRQWKFCPSCGKKVDVRANVTPESEDEHGHDILFHVTR